MFETFANQPLRTVLALGCMAALVGCNSGGGTSSGTSGGPGYLTVPLAGWWHGSWSRNTTLTDIVVDTSDVTTHLDPQDGVARLQITSAGGSSQTISGSLMMSGFECFDDGSMQGSWSGSNVGISVYSQLTLVETAGVSSTITQVSGGSGYSSVPTVAFSSPEHSTGKTATGHAVISGKGSIASIATTAGNGYTSAPTVTISAPKSSGGTTATAVAVLGGPGRVESIAVNNGGTAYDTGTNTCTIVAPDVSGGVQATCSMVVLATGVVSGIVVNEPGSGYTIVPAVTLSGTVGQGATGTVTLESSDAGQVVAINLTNPGSGYVLTPSVTLTSGGGSGAVGTATLTTADAGQVTAIVLDSAGSGYETPPSVTISGGGGAGAIFTAELDDDVGSDAVRLSLSGHQTAGGQLKLQYSVASGECEAKRGSMTLSKSS